MSSWLTRAEAPTSRRANWPTWRTSSQRLLSRGGAGLGDRTVRGRADGQRRAVSVHRRRNGQARGAGAQRGQRHRYHALLRDRRWRRRRMHPARILHARRAALSGHARRIDVRRRSLARRSALAPGGDARPSRQRARVRGALLQTSGDADGITGESGTGSGARVERISIYGVGRYRALAALLFRNAPHCRKPPRYAEYARWCGRGGSQELLLPDFSTLSHKL